MAIRWLVGKWEAIPPWHLTGFGGLSSCQIGVVVSHAFGQDALESAQVQEDEVQEEEKEDMEAWMASRFAS